MKKLFFILTSALLLIPEFINAGNPIIIIREGDTPPDEQNNPRSIGIVTASIEDCIISIFCSSQTESRIVVTDTNDSIVFDNSYESNYYFEANLSSLISGRYVLNIFAYGMWWVGEFELY